jgi:flagellar basal body rod protein FlgF
MAGAVEVTDPTERSLAFALAAAREFFRRMYEVEESKGETIEIALDDNGMMSVQVTKKPEAYAKQIEITVEFKKP